jgi:hypothetical protein
MFFGEIDCCHIVRELPNESHKIRIDIDFRVVRVRESRKSHMILPIAKLLWRETLAQKTVDRRKACARRRHQGFRKIDFRSRDALNGERVSHMACSTLPLEIVSEQLTRCYYVALSCRQHGEIRAAIQDVPVDRFHPCPVCHRECEYTLLGRGGNPRRSRAVLCQ